MGSATSRRGPLLALALLASLAITGVAVRAAPPTAEDPLRAGNEIAAILSAEKNMVGHSRVSGMLCDLLRVQKRLFASRHANGRNGVAARVEELLNDAGMAASQENWTESYAALGEATALALDSLRRLSPGESASR